MKIFSAIVASLVFIVNLYGWDREKDSQSNREALIAIYNANSDASFGVNWNTNLTFCRWEGVACENVSDTNVVAYMSLHSKQITSLPKEISKLTNLTGLYLDGNQLTSLPNEIDQLTNLDSLHLGDNKFTSIPEEIWQLTNLAYLKLENNYLKGNIPFEITNLSNLKRISLNYNCSLKSDNQQVKELIDDKGFDYSKFDDSTYEDILKTNGHCGSNMSPVYYLLLN